MKQKITTFLWFEHQAEEAARFYVSTFKNSEITSISRAGGEHGSVISVTFQLEGQPFIALNGGPEYKFTTAISLFVDCIDQHETDELWARLSDGGKPGRCGWLEDRFGLSWQIIPRALAEMLQDEDVEKSQRALHAMFTMGKIDIEALRRAHSGASD